eukprot:3430714-Prymnesium_polylepis.1
MERSLLWRACSAHSGHSSDVYRSVGLICPCRRIGLYPSTPVPSSRAASVKITATPGASSGGKERL